MAAAATVPPPSMRLTVDIDELFAYMDDLKASFPRCDVCQNRAAIYAPRVGMNATRCREHAPFDWHKAMRRLCTTCGKPARNGTKWMRATACDDHVRPGVDMPCMHTCAICQTHMAFFGIVEGQAMFCRRCRKQYRKAIPKVAATFGVLKLVCNAGQGRDDKCDGKYHTCYAYLRPFAVPSHGLPGCKPVRCERHALPGDEMTRDLRMCIYNSCHRRSFFGVNVATHCGAHRQPGESNVWSVDVCRVCRLTGVNSNVNSVCRECAPPALSPTDKGEREVTVVRFLRRQPHPICVFEWNAPIMGLIYNSRRPDLYYEFAACRVIGEVDENGHTNYDDDDEELRIREMVTTLGVTKAIIIVRYNPDWFLMYDKWIDVDQDVRLAMLLRLIEMLAALSADNADVLWSPAWLKSAIASFFDTNHVQLHKSYAIGMVHVVRMYYTTPPRPNGKVADVSDAVIPARENRESQTSDE